MPVALARTSSVKNDRVRLAGLIVIAACAPLPPPRAVVSVHANEAMHYAVLVTPTRCTASEPELCSAATYRTSSQTALAILQVEELVDPIVRLKLELAGYTLSDARTLRLETVGRTDVTVQGDASGQTTPTSSDSHVEQGPTVADLSPADQAAAASSLGLTGVLRSTLNITHESAFATPNFELVLELFALPDGRPLWTVRCREPFENFEDTSRLLASCVGDGVLAWRAPDAVIGRPQ
jgi:hypothetical protein